MIAVLNRWAAFLYGPLMDDRPRRLTEGMADGHGREMAQNVFGELRRMGGVRPPREFVFMDRAAIGLGAVFIHLRASINWHRLFEGLIDGFDVDALAARQQEALDEAGLSMNILVTGSSGWLGQTLVPRLERDGHRVVGLDPEPGRPPIRGLGRRPRAGPPCSATRRIEAIVHARRATSRTSRRTTIGVRGGERAGHAQPPGGGGGAGLEGRPLRLHLDHLADDLAEDPRRQKRGAERRSGSTRRWRRSSRATSTASPSSPPRNCAGCSTICTSLPIVDPAHLAVLPRGGRHGARHRAVGRQHQGQRVPVPPALGRGRGRSACRGARQGAARSASTPSSSRR